MTKPMGPIPPAFAGQQGMLTIAGRSAVDWLAGRDGPVFVYDPATVAERVARFRAAFPSIDLHYAIKANPFQPLLEVMAGLIDGFDVASAGELVKVAGLGRPVSFAGPGKRDAELTAAIAAGVTLNLESDGEAARALAIADRLGHTPRLAVRVNPDVELRGSGMKMGGRPSPFGIDAVRVPALVRDLVAAGADWRGFHIYAGSQALDPQAIIDTQAATLALAARLAEEAGHAPPLVNLGGGFGVPYFAGDRPLDIEAVGAALEQGLAARPAILRDTRFAIELGRWLVAEAGVYLARVLDRKESGGETFLILDGGLNHQLAASGNFGTVVRRNYPLALAHAMGAEPLETVSVVGPLCTPLDRLGDRVALPRGAVGDIVAIFLAGAYGATASPSAFLGHPPAGEVLGDAVQP
ncbi:pyridoxal-dependent decarboxylase, exosortase A system-associated [Sphingomonas sanguinis]|jgi:diaminopimelate decarboxylase|uniref:Pyridoxal-dependent decarboxylase, exosortase A system-associated n=1 Tax=Sphingomonas sanguinis TaxID=33051 RepID=A0A7Y7QYQ8_9SPHN|nr:pyridoxal-dependent decarboxylase, exosortase A system-associated [Sphingomonas sanguinis]MBZ6383438.1 pyridoxal-dependent decarboxylase, exosortase A system-associated [Sphingomonas sanguinis]NNG48718.1 pyridoxal-dependent decarboxylase, exosortase A system-associated [Sphingomonas sanguinis]NNG51963.1 pyridoxal-dependent decarboxylase, exosortase A system-associated [Sphingomonas sanguinis]NVP32734.1 pyridoxal-dependent decarboxylase, exosortase A system-associated [Sphingomonas sanguinis]